MASNGMIHFLIVFDHKRNELLQADPFTDAQEAATRYAQLEEEHRHETDLEIVLVGSDSIETIHRTHGHYFAASKNRTYSRFLVDF